MTVTIPRSMKGTGKLSGELDECLRERTVHTVILFSF